MRIRVEEQLASPKELARNNVMGLLNKELLCSSFSVKYWPKLIWKVRDLN